MNPKAQPATAPTTAETGGYIAAPAVAAGHQGTESLLTLAADLRETAPHVVDVFDLRKGARLMEKAADALERLAELEPDINVEPGVN